MSGSAANTLRVRSQGLMISRELFLFYERFVCRQILFGEYRAGEYIAGDFSRRHEPLELQQNSLRWTAQLLSNGLHWNAPFTVEIYRRNTHSGECGRVGLVGLSLIHGHIFTYKNQIYFSILGLFQLHVGLGCIAADIYSGIATFFVCRMTGRCFAADARAILGLLAVRVFVNIHRPSMLTGFTVRQIIFLKLYFFGLGFNLFELVENCRKTVHFICVHMVSRYCWTRC